MTLGCRFQEKSFNVAVKQDKPLDICKCGNEIRRIKYYYNGEVLCQVCFASKKSLRQRLDTTDFGFNTPKDKLYEFIDNKNFKTPTEVRGKKHWNKLLKQHGLIDDIKGVKENLPKPIDRRFIADQINRELQEKGLRDKLIRRR